jgi:hypothetical protein
MPAEARAYVAAIKIKEFGFFVSARVESLSMKPQ